MLLTTTSTILTLGAITVGSASSNGHRSSEFFFRVRKPYKIVPIDSSLCEAPLIRTLARGLKNNDPDYLVACLRILVTASTHHTSKVPSTELLLDNLVSLLRRHCHFKRVYKRIHSMKVHAGSEQDYAYCLFASTLTFLINEDNNSKPNTLT